LIGLILEQPSFMSGYSVPGATGAGYGYDQFSEAEPIFPDFDRPFPKRKVMKIDPPPSSEKTPKTVYNSKANAVAKLESKQNAMLNAAAEAAANAVEAQPRVESLRDKKSKRSKKEHLTDFNDPIKIFPQDLVIIFVIFVIIVMCFSIIRSLNNIQNSLKEVMYMNMVLLSKVKNQ